MKRGATFNNSVKPWPLDARAVTPKMFRTALTRIPTIVRNGEITTDSLNSTKITAAQSREIRMSRAVIKSYYNNNKPSEFLEHVRNRVRRTFPLSIPKIDPNDFFDHVSWCAIWAYQKHGVVPTEQELIVASDSADSKHSFVQLQVAISRGRMYEHVGIFDSPVHSESPLTRLRLTVPAAALDVLHRGLTD